MHSAVGGYNSFQKVRSERMLQGTVNLCWSYISEGWLRQFIEPLFQFVLICSEIKTSFTSSGLGSYPAYKVLYNFHEDARTWIIRGRRFWGTLFHVDTGATAGVGDKGLTELKNKYVRIIGRTTGWWGSDICDIKCRQRERKIWILRRAMHIFLEKL